MAKNYYFENFENSMEQSLVEDLVIESIKIYGIDVWYIPRTLTGKDDILNEDDISKFKDAYMAEMYVKSVDGFEGEGDFLSKFGLEIRDSITMTIARRTYESEVALHNDTVRPLEGDLIYLPLNNKIFEIQHVEHESIFYQMGSLQMYDLRAELFEFSGERFDTGQPFIDNLYKGVNTFESLEISDHTYIVDIDSVQNFRVKLSSSDRDVLSTKPLELKINREYIFDLSDSSLTGHLFNFYPDGDGATESFPTAVRTGTAGQAGANLKLTPTAVGDHDYRSFNGATRRNLFAYSEDLVAGLAAGVWQVKAYNPEDGVDYPVHYPTLASVSQAGVGLNGTATRITFPGSSLSDGTIYQEINHGAALTPSRYKASIWVRNASPGLKAYVASQAYRSWETAQYIYNIDIPVSSDWQRINIESSFPGQLTTPVLAIQNTTGAAGASVEVWGAQIEERTLETIADAPSVYQKVEQNYNANTANAFGNIMKVIQPVSETLGDNVAIESFGDNLIDFTEINPFGDNDF